MFRFFFLLYRVSLAREWPVLVQQNLLLPLLFRNPIDRQVLEEVHAGLSRAGNIQIAVTIQIHDHKLRPRTRRTIHRIG